MCVTLSIPTSLENIFFFRIHTTCRFKVLDLVVYENYIELVQNQMFGVRIYFNSIGPICYASLVVAGLPKMSSSDREVLLAFYRATDGSQWRNNYGWNTDADISSWYGVKVRDGRVVKLDLGRNNLKGNIPSHRL